MKIELCRKSTPLQNTAEFNTIRGKLLEVMESKPKIQGFSAPQMGIYKRAFFIRRKGILTYFTNPEVLWAFGKKKSLEGCESVNDRWFVKRPLIMKIRYVGDTGYETRIFFYKSARIICHEMDHLEGVTIKDVGKRWRGSAYVR